MKTTNYFMWILALFAIGSTYGSIYYEDDKCNKSEGIYCKCWDAKIEVDERGDTTYRDAHTHGPDEVTERECLAGEPGVKSIAYYMENPLKEGGIPDKQEKGKTETFVYPNPANDELNFDFRFNDVTVLELAIKTTLGQTVRTLNRTFEMGENHLYIDASGFEGGTYFYVVRYDDHVEQGKFMVLH